jgi:hypothetical protein
MLVGTDPINTSWFLSESSCLNLGLPQRQHRFASFYLRSLPCFCAGKRGKVVERPGSRLGFYTGASAAGWLYDFCEGLFEPLHSLRNFIWEVFLWLR